MGAGRRCPRLKPAVCCFQEEWDHSSGGSAGSRPGSGSRRGSGSRSGSRGRSSQCRQPTKVLLVATVRANRVLCLPSVPSTLLVCVPTPRVRVDWDVAACPPAPRDAQEPRAHCCWERGLEAAGLVQRNVLFPLEILECFYSEKRRDACNYYFFFGESSLQVGIWLDTTWAVINGDLGSSCSP